MTSRMLGALVVALGIGSVALPMGAVASVDAPVDAGSIEFVDANNLSRQIIEGDSTTTFSIRPPAESYCPGDSANDDWRVQSFIIPAELDPGQLQYSGVRPIGQHALYGAADTRPYVHAFTNPNPGPGQPGKVLDSPPLSLAVFPAGEFPEGRYRIGLACTYFRETAKFWDTEVEFVAAPEVQPGELRWRVIQPTAPAQQSSSGGGSSGTVLVLALVAALVGVVLILRSRRKPRSLPHS